MYRFSILLAILLVSCKPKIGPNTDVIIIPLGDVPAHQIDSVEQYLAAAYNIAPQIVTPVTLPKNAFINVKRARYRADSLLVYLKTIRKAEGADFAFGLTAEDISTTKRNAEGNIKKPENKYKDWGIMGLAYRPGREAVVSSFRLKRKPAFFYQRLQKVVIHEFGHNLGLPHCPDKSCVMADAAERISTIDHCEPVLCAKCYNSLSSAM